MGPKDTNRPSTRHPLLVLAASVTLIATSACGEATPDVVPSPGIESQTGGSGSGGAESPSGVGGTEGPGPVMSLHPTPNCKTQAQAAPLRRLNRFELANTLTDLFPTATIDVSGLPGETSGNGFYNDAREQKASPLLVEQYRYLARELAAAVAADDLTAQALGGCSASEATCPAAFIESFGLRAFRRPPSVETKHLLTEVFTLGRASGGFAGGVRAVVEAALQLPQFLYRLELAEPVANGNYALLDPYELATRLSYLMWGTMPDQVLLDAAAAGSLVSREQVLEHARRMVNDPRARRVVEYFHGELFKVSGAPKLQRAAEEFPTFSPGMGELFLRETQTFLSHIVFDEQGGMGDFYTAPYTFLNEPLAKFYGIPGVSGTEFQKVGVDPVQRGGLLTHASVLAMTTPGSSTNPVVRGAFMNHQVMCVDVPPPPPTLKVVVPEIAEGVSVREAFRQHRDNPDCAGCHELLDPPGFAFSNYNGVPVDASGVLAASDVAGEFKDLAELSDKVAKSQGVHDCYVNHWLTFAYGRKQEAADTCVSDQLKLGFYPAGAGNVKELLVSLTQTDAFMLSPIPAIQ